MVTVATTEANRVHFEAGCVYQIREACHRGCRPAETCKLGQVVFRSDYGGHHHAHQIGEPNGQ